MVPSTYSTHHFIADILDNNNVPVWRAVGIYGWPEREYKHKTWEMMGRITAMSRVPCIMFGDFNEILCHEEKEGGVPRGEREMDAFRGAMDECRLCDLGYKGCQFTWKRGNSPTTLIRERLDRFLADGRWCDMFPNHMVRHFAQYRSDHAPILLSTWSPHDRGRSKKSFRFEALWLSKPDCANVVAQAWMISAGENVADRVGSCAESLTQWAATSFGNIKKKIRDTEEKLRVRQTRYRMRICWAAARNSHTSSMSFTGRRNLIGLRGLEPTSYVMGIKTPPIFIKRRVKEDTIIPLLGSLMRIIYGEIRRRT